MRTCIEESYLKRIVPILKQTSSVMTVGECEPDRPRSDSAGSRARARGYARQDDADSEAIVMAL